MLLDDHHHFFQGSIACSFTQTIDGAFDLPCAGNNACNGIGCCQSEIIMTMAGNNCLINIAYIVYEISDFFAILMRKAITGVSGIFTTVAPALITASITRARYSLSVRPASSA